MKEQYYKTLYGAENRLDRRQFITFLGSALGATTAAITLPGCDFSTEDAIILPERVSPFIGESLFVDPNSNAVLESRSLKETNSVSSSLLEKIAKQPSADWFGDWNTDIEEDVNKRVTEISSVGSLPVLVLYNIPDRDCGNFSAGGAKSSQEYLQWINKVIKGIDGRKVITIFEPDALGLLDRCRNKDDQSEHLKLMDYAINQLVLDGNINVYIDSSQWTNPKKMADRLKAVGIEKVSGVAINTSGYENLDNNKNYLRELQRYLKGLHAVIDTSRNGKKVPSQKDSWCNPVGAALGKNPSLDTQDPYIDAYLWIKKPGESDGDCKGGPPAGQWWRDQAISLSRNAE